MKKDLLLFVLLALFTAVIPAKADSFTYTSVQPAARTVLSKSSSGYAPMSFTINFDREVSIANFRANVQLHKATADGAIENPDNGWQLNLSSDKKSLTTFGMTEDEDTYEFYVNQDYYYLVIPEGTVKDNDGNVNSEIVIKYYGNQSAKDNDSTVDDTNEGGLITQQPAGDLKIYERSGYSYYVSQGDYVRRGAQTGTVNIVYGKIGVYIKDPIDKTNVGTWVKATINADSTTITLPLGQAIYYDETQKDSVILGLMDFDEEYEEFTEDTKTKEVTYTVKDNTITLNGTGRDKILAAMWKKTRGWALHGDYTTKYTLQVTPDTALVVPASLETETYKLHGNSYTTEQALAYNVTVGFDGNDMYIKGIFKDTPNAWIKGTKQGDSYVFPSGQFLSKAATGTTNYYMIATNHVNTSQIEDLKLTYDESVNGYTTDQFLVLNTAKQTVYLIEAIDKIVISKEQEEGAYNVPYTENFSGGLDDYTVIDANKDGNTWRAGMMSGVEYDFSNSNAGDDWLISPKINLAGGKHYKVTVNARSFTASLPEKFEVKMGTDNTVAAQTTTVIPETVVATGDLTDFVGYVTPSADGKYNFGIHAISDADNQMLRVGSFSVVEVENLPAGINTISNTKSNKLVDTYNLAGQRVSKQAKGVVIKKYADGSIEKVIVK